MRTVIARSAIAFFACVAVSAAAGEAKGFGKPLTGLAATPLATVLASPEPGKLVRLEGTIEAVCQGKGCWLELRQGDKSVHVTFEGYAFFVPKDSKGKPCALEGRVVVKEPAPEEVEHKKAEGALSAGQTVSIEAVGVEIRTAP